MIEWILGLIYLLAGPLAWAGFAFVMVKGRGRMRILVRPAPPLPAPAPRVSILVPAKDEAGQIEKCVRSILQQDYPDFELIVIDDRSTDGTGAILDQLTANDSRLKVVHLQEGSLPVGWGGKSFALHSGLERATGAWLLMVDADVQLERDVLSATIAWAHKREFEMISILPAFVSETLAEGILQPLAGAATGAMFMIALTNSREWNTAFANGQYLCVRRDAYDAVGGHEAIRGTLSEDVALARKLKLAGYSPRLGWGDSWAIVRMYAGLASIVRGWTRNFYVGSLGRPWRILALVSFILLCGYSLLPALAWGIHRHAHPVEALHGWGWMGSALTHLLAMTGTLALMYRMAREPAWYALLFLPFGAPVLLFISARSLWTCITGRVVWRGTQYARRELAPDRSERQTHAGA